MFLRKDIDLLQGYPMAKNLRAKIPETDTLIICDTNPKATGKFVEEVGIATSSTNSPGKGTGIHIAENPREVAQKSVSLSRLSDLLAASS
jgi:3-hydroxyisobutyrate dehydrogenase